jgi:hypothetical protein
MVDLTHQFPEPLDLLAIAGVVAINTVTFPVVNVHFLHTAQHQLQKAKKAIRNCLWKLLAMWFRWNSKVGINPFNSANPKFWLGVFPPILGVF